jgi:hypothetical protein
VPAGLQINGPVLCIAEEGHVAIEWAGHGCCGATDDTSCATESPPLRAAADSEPRCGHCTDIPLPPGDSAPRIPPPTGVSHDALAAAMSLSGVLLPADSKALAPGGDRCCPRPAETLAALRTVILLL